MGKRTRRELAHLCYCFRLPRSWPAWRKGRRCFCGEKEGHTTFAMKGDEAAAHFNIELAMLQESRRIRLRRVWIILWITVPAIGAAAGAVTAWGFPW